MEILFENVQKVIKERPKNSHKGDYGRLLLIGGFYPYAGAIHLSAQAALAAGAGLVTVATERDAFSSLHALVPEAMALDIEDSERIEAMLAKQDLVLFGPGTEDSTRVRTILAYLLENLGPDQVLILDAGALRAFPFVKVDYACTLVFTPHQKEFEALTGLSLEQQTQDNNQQAVDRLGSSAYCILKKAGSELYQSGQVDFDKLTIGGPYQATAGMGDCLAGILAAFCAQFKKVTLRERLAAGLYLHSWVADQLAEERYVVQPSQISAKLPYYMKRIASSSN